MNKYLVSLGKNSSSLKKVLISLPNGIYDLKFQAPEGMLLDRTSYMYAFMRGLKNLINSSIVKVSVKNGQKDSRAGVKLVSNRNTEQAPLKMEKSLMAEEKQAEVVVAPETEPETEPAVGTETVVEETPAEEKQAEVVVAPETEPETEPAVGTETVVEETPAEEQPKKKSKKKK